MGDICEYIRETEKSMETYGIPLKREHKEREMTIDYKKDLVESLMLATGYHIKEEWIEVPRIPKNADNPEDYGDYAFNTLKLRDATPLSWKEYINLLIKKAKEKNMTKQQIDNMVKRYMGR